MDRQLDGIYFRILRNGNYESVCFSDLTDEEMDLVLKERSHIWLQSLCKSLGKRIREIGDVLNIGF